MFYVGGPRHGTAFPTRERPWIVRMPWGEHPQVEDPGERTEADPVAYADIRTATTYYLRPIGIVLAHPLTGKPNPHAHRIHVYIHESLQVGTPAAMQAVQDATLRWALATFGEEVVNPLHAQQNGNHPTTKETP